MAKSAPKDPTLWQALNALAHKGQRIGLYGGSFNPPHAGHIHVARQALIKGALDMVVFLVTPVSPHKTTEPPAPLSWRAEALTQMTNHPRMRVSCLEAALNTTFTAETLTLLTKRMPDVHWVWIAGADSLTTCHRWRRPDDIIKQATCLFIDRPGQMHKAVRSPFAIKHGKKRNKAKRCDRKNQAWVYVFGKTHTAASSQLRQQPDWQRRAFGLSYEISG